ncbi:hypothetical protein [uncultured Deinococcus sp.]|uniref:hypothetical protein n=1 Tax=uncultured Deinococcus sp. TaxID=158789 RepID=UPI0025851FC6|nr:hypothetical protein [uncultured Deinococcus sp.]
MTAVTLVDCAECEGKGRAWYDVGRESDGTPIEARLTCAVCHGEGKVPVVCPECLGTGIALVASDWGEPYDEFCLKCALYAIEHGDGYTPEQVAEIRAQAVAAGLLVPQSQPEQQQAQALTEEEHDRLLEFELDAQDALEAATRRPVSTRRPLTEHEQEDRWQQDDLMERRAAFLREDY